MGVSHILLYTTTCVYLTELMMNLKSQPGKSTYCMIFCVIIKHITYIVIDIYDIYKLCIIDALDIKYKTNLHD